MGISYRSSYNAPGGDVNLDSFYVICGDKKWLRGQTINNADLTTNVVIGDNYCNAGMLFRYTNLNQPLYIGNNVSNLRRLLPTTYNSYVTIGDNVKNCAELFYDCSEFNKPIIIPNNVSRCDHMFCNCDSFNQPINIPDSVTGTHQMFAFADNFNSDVTIGNNAYVCSLMFQNCINFNANVYVKYKGTSMYTTNMFLNVGGAKIHFDPSMNFAFNGSTTYGLSEITWTDMSDGNGFYNSAYNIYCYNNYVV